MADDELNPGEPNRPDDVHIDPLEKPDVMDELSAKAMGDILDESTESLDPDDVEDIRTHARFMNDQAAARAQAEFDAQTEAEAETEAEIQASINAEGKVRRALMRLAVGIVLFASVYGCTQIFGGDDDSAQLDTVGDETDSLESAIGDVGSDTGVADGSGDETDETEDDTSDTGDTTDETAANVPDDLFRPQAYTAMMDGDLQLWLRVEAFAKWSSLPPEFFSAFWKFLLSVNPTGEVGWETHNGSSYVLGNTSEAYILDDGSVVFATGIFPTRPFVLEIDANFGSWPDEDGPPAVFGEESSSIESALIEDGDPLADFGAAPVFDLVAGS